MKAKFHYTLAKYFTYVGLFGLLANLFGWYRAWFWLFVLSFILGYAFFQIAHREEQEL
jgi:hypothetical protein